MSTTTDRWVILRQVVLGVPDIEVATTEFRDELGLGEGFADPMLEDIGMSDETIRVGVETHLEFVGPLREDVSIAKWLSKGGPGGYCFSIQVSDIDARIERAAELGIRTVVDLEVQGHRVIQLHPADMGLLVELDGIGDANVWFWDDIETAEPPAPAVDDIVSVTLTSSDPQAQVHLWADLFEVPITQSDDAPAIKLGTRTLRFAQGPRSTFTSVDLRATPGTSERELTLSGVRLRVLA